jgi:hypothetical protein
MAYRSRTLGPSEDTAFGPQPNTANFAVLKTDSLNHRKARPAEIGPEIWTYQLRLFL